MSPEIFTRIGEVKYAKGPMQPAQTHACKMLQTVSGVEDPVPWSFNYVLNVPDMLMKRGVTQL
jgi:hypothetical protein